MDMIETTGTQLRQSILDGFSKALDPKWPPSPSDLMAPEDVILFHVDASDHSGKERNLIPQL